MNDPKEILRKIRRLELRTRRLVESSFAGQYQSVFKGRGMNFEEVRPYTPGDEIRSIDWNVTARTGEPYIKKFTEEREMTVMILLDVSASGNFGSVEESKREMAAEVAAILAFSAIHNNDKVGLLLFSDRVELFIPPKKGRHHILRLIREMLYFEPAGRGTDLSGALEYLNKVVARRFAPLRGFRFPGTRFLKAAHRHRQAPRHRVPSHRRSRRGGPARCRRGPAGGSRDRRADRGRHLETPHFQELCAARGGAAARSGAPLRGARD